MNIGGESRHAVGQRWRPPPHLYFVVSALFHALGPAFAVLLFSQLSVAGVAWLRIVSAGVVFLVWRAPWRTWRANNARARGLILALACVLATMNFSFYMAIDQLPLGTVAAIEFIGPIVIALVGFRTARNFLALALGALGVWLLADVRLAGSHAGFLWAFANAALFALYILIAHRLARADPDSKPVDRLAAAAVIAAFLVTPFGFTAAAPAFADPWLLLAGVGVGISSSVIPYVLDQLAMSRLAQSSYALFLALLPATAVVIGVVVLGQIPVWSELLGVALVMSGIVAHREAASPSPKPQAEMRTS